MTQLARFTLSLLALSAIALPGATVFDAALGSSLAGATVTVTRFGGAMSSATFAAAGSGAAAVSPGSAGFSLTVTAGDTSAATWTLTNTDPSTILLNRIVAVTIDLTLSGRALFDSGIAPSTPLSGPGLAGVTPLAGVPILSASEFLLWPDAANTGDMHLALSITFDGGFTALASSSWMDDTDITDVPEPAGPGLAACVALLLGGIATRRRASASLSRRNRSASSPNQR